MDRYQTSGTISCEQGYSPHWLNGSRYRGPPYEINGTVRVPAPVPFLPLRRCKWLSKTEPFSNLCDGSEISFQDPSLSLISDSDLDQGMDIF
jgi:hypothetical protein